MPEGRENREEAVLIDGPAGPLEGLYCPCGARVGVVVTHPHPLYGGDMHNRVAASICRVYRRLGFASLRFNFRGVGRSEGTYGEGVGEQDDLRAAVSWMAAAGIQSVDLAGYSFGAWVIALAGGEFAPVQRLVMVSPPVALIDFSAVGALPRLALVATGDRDDIAPAEKVRAALAYWNPAARFAPVAGADHFFSGALDRLEAVLDAGLRAAFPDRR